MNLEPVIRTIARWIRSRNPNSGYTALADEHAEQAGHGHHEDQAEQEAEEARREMNKEPPCSATVVIASM